MKALIEKIICYYKYIYTTFEQPPLYSNGTLGGDSFAVYATTNGGTPDRGRGTAYGAAYPQSGSYNTYSKGGRPTTWYTLYTPKPTLINGCSFTAVWGNYSDSYMDITFEGSADNSSWVTLYPTTRIHEGSPTITFANDNTYNYYRLTIGTTGGGYHDGIYLSQVKLIGDRKIVGPGTEDDYDYMGEGCKTSIMKNVDKYYALKSWRKR